MVRVLICDDQTVVRDGLAAILSTDPEIEVVGTAANGAEAVAIAASVAPDVVLMDLKMPVMDGVRATRALRGAASPPFVLVLTTYADDEWLIEAVRAGASGYLLKDVRREELLAAIKGTAAGKSYVDPTVAGRLMRQVSGGLPVPRPAPGPALAEQLSERELEILRLVARGLSNPEIAEELHLAAGTVRNYVSGMLQKLGVDDRTQAALLAQRRGWLG